MHDSHSRDPIIWGPQFPRNCLSVIENVAIEIYYIRKAI